MIVIRELLLRNVSREKMNQAVAKKDPYLSLLDLYYRKWSSMKEEIFALCFPLTSFFESSLNHYLRTYQYACMSH